MDPLSCWSVATSRQAFMPSAEPFLSKFIGT